MSKPLKLLTTIDIMINGRGYYLNNFLCDMRVISAIQKKYGFRFSKSLGQNFLINEDVPAGIAQAAGIDADTGVIEIGPGFGTLTFELCERAKKVVAIELDKSLIPVLADTMQTFKNLTVINQDFMKLDALKLIEEEFFNQGIKKVILCANLPYYITTPIIMAVLEQRLPLESITVMIQKEVADRLCATVPGRDYGAITLSVQYYTTARKLFDVQKEDFMPSPKVTSSVISLVPNKTPRVIPKDEKHMFGIIKAAYAKRRKTLANALSTALCLPRETVVDAITGIGLNADIRGERLTLEDFCQLSNIL